MKKQTQKNHWTSNLEKSSNPREKTKPRNLKQTNTHREKNPSQRESDLNSSFPHSLSNQTQQQITTHTHTHTHTHKTIISFNFVTLYQTQSMIYMPRPSDEASTRWRRSCAMEAMPVPIYFEHYDVDNNVKRVPKEVMDSIRRNKVDF